MKSRRRTNHRTRFINSIFDSSTDDLSYIINNDELLKEHIKFIRGCAYVLYSSMTKYTELTKDNEKRIPRSFEYFNTKYKYIYKIWIHLVRCCYDPSYNFYKFFGAKGITMSGEFRNAKKFCIWCLKNGLTGKPFMYTKYIQRKNKNKLFSKNNCFVITEKELHECNSLKLALNSIILIKNYEKEHHPSVSYMTYYTRYYIYDMNDEDARMFPCMPNKSDESCGYFSPATFYDSVADENSCTRSVFLSRMHYSYMNGGLIIKPYEMLEKDFSITEFANRQNMLSYKQQWDRNKKEQLKKESNNNTVNNINVNHDVYSVGEDVYNLNNYSVYSNGEDVYKKP